MHPSFLTGVLLNLDSNHVTITDLLLYLISSSHLSHQAARNNMIDNVSSIMEALFTMPESLDACHKWLHENAKKVYTQEVRKLTDPTLGFRFNALHAHADQIENFSMDAMEATILTYAPLLSDAVRSLLESDPDLANRRVQQIALTEPQTADTNDTNQEENDIDEDTQYWDKVVPLELEDLLEGYYDSADDNSDTDSSGTIGEDGLTATQRKRRKNAVNKRNALLRIRRLVVVCILLVTTNQRCNAFGGTLGFFLHSKNVPEKVVEALHHLGLSDSAQSIRNAVHSMSKEAEQKIFTLGRQLLCSVAFDNFDINLRTDSPTLSQDSRFVHAASATLIPLSHGVTLEDLHCSGEVYTKLGLDLNKLEEKVVLKHNDIFPAPRRVAPLPRHARRLLPFGGRRNAYTKRMDWHVLSILVHHSGMFGDYREELGQPDVINQIPVQKTFQVPLRAMEVNQSTVEGNADIERNILQQCGLGAHGVKHYSSESEVPLDNYVILTHGDLGTWERVQSVISSRRLEETPERRLQYVVFIPGLFHVKMAAADALWRTHVMPLESRHDEQATYTYINMLRPKEIGKFGSNPGFRRMHNVIHHILHAGILEGWRLEAMARGTNTLEELAAQKPTWQVLQDMARSIVDKFVAGTDFAHDRSVPLEARDITFENAILRNRDFLLYVELCHGLTHGDIGRVEAVLRPLILIFKGTGKHKYASALVHFLNCLEKIYPPGLSRAIRMNWLVNPTGSRDGFRPVDWLVELQNKYTKVIYGGQFSNRSLQLMIKQSVLIEVFRATHTVVEDWLHLTHRTKRHQVRDMQKTISRLCAYMAEGKVYTHTPGRSEGLYIVVDQVRAGWHLLEVDTRQE